MISKEVEDKIMEDIKEAVPTEIPSPVEVLLTILKSQSELKTTVDAAAKKVNELDLKLNILLLHFKLDMSSIDSIVDDTYDAIVNKKG